MASVELDPVDLRTRVARINRAIADTHEILEHTAQEMLRPRSRRPDILLAATWILIALAVGVGIGFGTALISPGDCQLR